MSKKEFKELSKKRKKNAREGLKMVKKRNIAMMTLLLKMVLLFLII